MPAKKSARNSKKQDTFLEQTIANIEERAKKEIEDIRERIEGGLEEATSRANQRSSKLEEAFDKRVAQAYNRMGLPSKADIVLLEAKIDDLQKAVDALLSDTGAATKSTSRKKSSAKKAAPKKTKTPSKKVPAKRSSVKKTPAKKAAARKKAPKKK